jgi:ubiquinone/menaquinone biosynthesis C-methylase UbiE
MNDSPQPGDLRTRSRVIHWAFRYDMMLKLMTLGRERRLRDKFLDLAKVAPGEIVLDAGCGPGTTAIAARRRVGDGGAVYGIDAAPEMIERAQKKAARAGAEVTFQPALLESLPFPDAKFDLVITSFVLHHFPADVLPRCLSEIRRVLKSGGRLVAFDFAGSGHRHGLFRRHDHPHESFNLNAITPALNAAGLLVRERGAAGFSRAVFITATPGAPDEQRDFPEPVGAAHVPGG